MFIWIVISFKILFARNSDLIMPLGTKIANACEGYKVVKKLGVGAFSRVFQVQGMYGEVAAIKCIKQSVISRVGTESIVREIKILRMLHHQHILELYDFAWDDKYIYLITEYCELGDLSRHIIKNKGVPRHLIHRFLQQLAHGLRFLRKHNVSHFDLKPSNLLVTRCPRLCLKIADFGFAQMMSDEERSNKIKGSPAYMAPEMILCQEYSAKADLWSVGIILYECLFGQLPLPNTACELVAHIEKNVPMPIPENARLSPACYNLLTWLLQYDPDSRIDFDSFFSHEFIDLEHYPCDKNYEKGVRFVYKAIEYDQNRQYHQAFEFYCEALRFMIPYLHEMEDPIQKRQLQQKVLEYTTRAEELKSIYFILNRETLKEPKTDPLEAVNEETRAMRQVLGRSAAECTDPLPSSDNHGRFTYIRRR